MLPLGLCWERRCDTAGHAVGSGRKGPACSACGTCKGAPFFTERVRSLVVSCLLTLPSKYL